MVNFIHYNKYSEFKTALDAGSLNDDSIIFIKDAKQIWTHGQLYSVSGSYIVEYKDDITSSNILQVGVPKTVTSDNVYFSAKNNYFVIRYGETTSINPQYANVWGNDDIWQDENIKPYKNILYRNKTTGKFYIYNGTSMEEVTGDFDSIGVLTTAEYLSNNYAVKQHTHPISDITDLESHLNDKIETVSQITNTSVNDIENTDPSIVVSVGKNNTNIEVTSKTLSKLGIINKVIKDDKGNIITNLTHDKGTRTIIASTGYLEPVQKSDQVSGSNRAYAYEGCWNNLSVGGATNQKIGFIYDSSLPTHHWYGYVWKTQGSVLAVCRPMDSNYDYIADVSETIVCNMSQSQINAAKNLKFDAWLVDKGKTFMIEFTNMSTTITSTK